MSARTLFEMRAASASDDGRVLFEDREYQAIPSRIRRLSRKQYVNTVRTVLGDGAFGGESEIPSEVDILLYDTNEKTLAVTEEKLLAFRSEAKRVANRNASRLATDSGCNGEAACLQRYVLGVAQRAFRRPLSMRENDAIARLLSEVFAREGAVASVEASLEYILQSSNFLYRAEESASGGVGQSAMSASAIAEQIAYLLTNAPPDDVLVGLAASGKLSEPSAQREQIDRLLKSDRFGEVYQDFLSQWLRYSDIETTEKSVAKFPEFTAGLRSAMAASVTEFANRNRVERKGNFVDLMLSDEYVSTSLGKNALNVVFGADARGARTGLLTHPAFLAAVSTDYTAPMQRASMMLNKVVCRPVGAPSGVSLDPKKEGPSGPPKTQRQAFALHLNPECAACHRQLDPIAFTFESYDAIGRYRTTDNGEALDLTGDLSGGHFPVGPFSNAVDLVQKLATNQDVLGCFVSQWFEYLHGRPATIEQGALLRASYLAFVQSGFNTNELVRSLLSPQFATLRAKSN
jgi:hypothetical protein